MYVKVHFRALHLHGDRPAPQSTRASAECGAGGSGYHGDEGLSCIVIDSPGHGSVEKNEVTRKHLSSFSFFLHITYVDI